MKLVLFLGAGFSAHFKHPVMDQFFNTAAASDRLSKDEKALIGQLILDARRANAFLESSPTNLEDILSFAEMGERLQLVTEGPSRADALKQILAKVYSRVDSAAAHERRGGNLNGFIGCDPRVYAERLSFITTNYDLNVDFALWQLGTPAISASNATQDAARKSDEAELYRSGGPALFKLHGSLNWFANPATGNSGLLVDSRIVRVTNNSTMEHAHLPYAYASDYPRPSTPVLVPPSFLKPELAPSLRQVWSGAAQALSEATIVAFVGYSFPSSDTEMMYFLARAFAENAALQQVILVDPAADRIAARLGASSSKLGSHFRSLLRPLAHPWENLGPLPVDWP
jgi:hypothetical protein